LCVTWNGRVFELDSSNDDVRDLKGVQHDSYSTTSSSYNTWSCCPSSCRSRDSWSRRPTLQAVRRSNLFTRLATLNNDDIMIHWAHNSLEWRDWRHYTLVSTIHWVNNDIMIHWAHNSLRWRDWRHYTLVSTTHWVNKLPTFSCEWWLAEHWRMVNGYRAVHQTFDAIAPYRLQNTVHWRNVA